MALPLFNIGGLASGLDTNSIISSLIEVERIPVQQLLSRKSDIQAKDVAWQDVNTRFSAIRTALDAIETSDELAKLVSAASSNENAMTASASGSATPSSLSFTIDQLAANHQVASTANFTGGDDLVGAGDITLTVGGDDHVVTADATTTLNDLALAINNLDVGVSATVLSIDGTDHELTLTAADTGLASVFTTAATITSLASTSIVQQGQDAEVTVGSGPGALTLSRSSNTITDLVGGVTVNLHETTAAAVTLTVGRDLDAVVTHMTTFVDSLNSALTALNSYTSYDSASDTAGLLLGDSTARGLIVDLRNALTSVVNDQNGTYAVSGSVGLSLNRDGTIDFEEATLRSALEDDFDAVAELFTSAGAATTGIGGAFDAVLGAAEGAAGTIARARNTWQSQVSLIDDRIDVLEDRIDRHEARLLKQFAALEVAMSTLSSQGAWLAAQLGTQTGGGSS